MGTINIWLVVCFIVLLVISQITVNKLNDHNESEVKSMKIKLTKRISDAIGSSLCVTGAIGVNLLSVLLLS